jgi:hypothetical protein
MTTLLKTFCTLIFCFGISFLSNGQSQPQTYHFGYDEAGNRTIRYIVKKASSEDVSEHIEDLIRDELVSAPEQPEPETTSSEFNLFPNPVNNELTVTLESSENAAFRYRLINSEGKVIQEGQVIDFPLSLNLESQKPGTYYLILYGENELQSFSIIKM